MKKCSNCMAENEQNAKNCFLCGHELHRSLLGRLFGGSGNDNSGSSESYGIKPSVDWETDYVDPRSIEETEPGGGPDAKYFKDLGSGYFRKGQFDKAIAALTEAIRMDPSYTDAYYNRGLSNLNIGRYEMAVEDFDAAVQLDPEDAEAYGNLGMARLRLGEAEQALRDYEEASLLDPTNPSYINGRGAAKFDLGLFTESVEEFSEAITLNAQDPYAYSNRAYGYINLGKHFEAEEDIAMATGLGLDTADVKKELYRRR